MFKSSNEEFEGFSQNQVDAAGTAQWYNQRLQQIGIGELGAIKSENYFSDDYNTLCS